MILTDKMKASFKASIETRALEYSADPIAGQKAGYQPEQIWIREPAEIGIPRRSSPRRSEYAAWLYGIARKDLPAGIWRIDEGMGDGPFSASLVML